MSKPITPQELHEHIQASIFGRPETHARRFDELQARLHELVDLPTELDIVKNFVERVFHKMEEYEEETGSPHSCISAVNDTLFEYEEADTLNETPQQNGPDCG